MLAKVCLSEHTIRAIALAVLGIGSLAVLSRAQDMPQCAVSDPFRNGAGFRTQVIGKRLKHGTEND